MRSIPRRRWVNAISRSQARSDRCSGLRSPIAHQESWQSESTSYSAAYSDIQGSTTTFFAGALTPADLRNGSLRTRAFVLSAEAQAPAQARRGDRSLLCHRSGLATLPIPPECPAGPPRRVGGQAFGPLSWILPPSPRSSTPAF
jgi:hypothetical protein